MRRSGLNSEILVWLDGAELEKFLARVQTVLSAGDFALVETLIETIRLLISMVKSARASIQGLRSMLFGPKTETTKKVLPDRRETEGDPATQPGTESPAPVREKRKGHGRHGGDDYAGGTRHRVAHQSLHAGDACPCCHKGKIYELKDPGICVFVKGQAPFAAEVWESMRLRCSRCTAVFTAALPEEVGKEKFDATAGSMVAVMKYGCGFPFYRLDRLEKDFRIPFPPSTQWQVVAKVAALAEPVFFELFRMAAQGHLFSIDDTTMQILEITKEIADRKRLPAPKTAEDAEDDSGKGRERTGVFTSAVVAEVEGHRIALFFTGTNHAGENFARVLDEREKGLAPPMEMSDGLSWNVPKDHVVIDCSCLVHGRRHFIKLLEDFPPECRFVIECLKGVYENDADAKKRALTPEERLAHHQETSRAIMDPLESWLEWKLKDKVIEPNSSLGRAIKYMTKRWEPLTRFLRVAGAPLDNNIAERILKLAILHRKNAYFYKTRNGARVGDILMTVIDTCRLGGVNPFEYLTAIQRNAERVRACPAEWLPWNYEATLAQLTASKAAG